MAVNAYLSLRGEKQGEIKGSVVQKGREGKIMVMGVEHGVGSPRDPVSGQVIGKRLHKPFVITKELDISSPALYAALVSNEIFPTWELQFWAPQVGAVLGAGTGAEVMRYTVRLTNARISDIRFCMLNNKSPDLLHYAEFEEVSFLYQRIEWTWTAGGKTSGDEWVTSRIASTKASTKAIKKAEPAVKARKRASRKQP